MAAVSVLLIGGASCKKLSPKKNENVLSATVKLMSGQTIEIHATETDAMMACGVGFSIDNSNQYPRPGLAIQAFDDIGNCIATTGTYAGTHYQCSFDMGSGMPTGVYENTGVADPGSVTFTSFSSSYVACSFHATCKLGLNDSVIINGTFQGNHFGY